MAGPPSRSTFPSGSSEPTSRRLGVGSSSSRERPLRAQIVVALVAVSVLIAVPLYLLRRPGGKSNAATSASSGLDAGRPLADGGVSGTQITPLSASKPPERLRVSPIQHVRCGASANGGHDGNVCESLPFFEDALTKAVRENPDCTPKANEGGTLNYVLTVDFQRKSLHLFPGASGQWRGKQARRSVNCIKRAFVAPDWATIQHQYRFYTIAALATYVPQGAANNAALPGSMPGALGTPSTPSAPGTAPNPNALGTPGLPGTPGALGTPGIPGTPGAGPHNPLGTPNFE